MSTQSTQRGGLRLAPSDESTNSLVRRAFGLVLARHREAAGYQQRVFSRVCGISNSHLRSIEHGDVSPTLATLWKIAGTLEVTPERLVREPSEQVRVLRNTRAETPPPAT
jgi:transcriptional regulator with XRE-family HTH domain